MKLRRGTGSRAGFRRGLGRKNIEIRENGTSDLPGGRLQPDAHHP